MASGSIVTYDAEMRIHHVSALAMSLSMSAACWIVAGTEDFEDLDPTGAGGGAAGGSGQGGGGQGPCMDETCLELGAPCMEASACESGFCAHGVCCESACDQACQLCGTDGTCAPVVDADDPNDQCEGAGMCDAASTCAEGLLVGLSLFGGASRDSGRSLTRDDDGNVFIVGETQGSFTFGTQIGAAPGIDAFVGKLNPNGLPLWGFSWGGASNDIALDVDTDGDGNAYFVGGIANDANWNGMAMGAANGTVNGYIIQVLPDGSPGWAYPLVTGGHDQMHAVRVRPNGNPLVAGFILGGELYFGEFPSTGGAEVFVTQFGSTGNNQFLAMEIRDDGRTALTGLFEGAATFGSEDVAAVGPGSDILVAVLDDFGRSARWAKSFGGASNGGTGLAVDIADDGRVALAGVANGASIDFGEGPVALEDDGESDVFVAVFDDDGELVFGTAFPGPGPQTAHGVAFDVDGNVIVSGNFMQTMSVLGTQTSTGNWDTFVLGVSASGTPLWFQSMGDGGSQLLYRMARDGNEMLAIGAAYGTLPLPDTNNTVSSDGADDILLLRFRP